MIPYPRTKAGMRLHFEPPFDPQISMIVYAHSLGETTRVRGPYPGEKSGNERSFRAPL